jgi:ATP-dependent Clp protease ATP-binding subunit ClpA
VFNIFLQILSDGRLTDNMGRTVSFADSIILMTTNTGQPFFLDKSLSFDEAKKNALEELGKTYRSELLNRFNGRQNIVCFNRLALPEIERIVRREISNVSKAYGEQGITLEMPDADLKAFCRDNYNPDIGARGLPGYIEATIEPKIARTILENPEIKGVVNVSYDEAAKKLDVALPAAAAPEVRKAAPANQNKAAPAGAGVTPKFNMN